MYGYLPELWLSFGIPVCSFFPCILKFVACINSQPRSINQPRLWVMFGKFVIDVASGVFRLKDQPRMVLDALLCSSMAGIVLLEVGVLSGLST